MSHSEREPTKRMQNELYCKQTHDGCIIAGSDCKVVSQDSRFDQMPTDDSIEHSKTFLTKIFPFIASVEIDRTWTGLMPYSPDEFPIIGKVECLPGEVYISGGLHGEGMSLGPGAGELLARLMTGDKEVKTLLECASPDRCCNLLI